MKKIKYVFIGLILFLLINFLHGCIDNFTILNGTIYYESHPVKIQYSIEYGYYINCSNNGMYKINYLITNYRAYEMAQRTARLQDQTLQQAINTVGAVG